MLKDLIARHPAWLAAALALIPVLIVAYGVARVVGRLVQLAMVTAVGDREPGAMALPAVRRPLLAVRLVVFSVTALALAFPALELAGLPLAGGLRAEFVRAWFFASGLRIALIGVLAWVLTRMISVLVRRFEYEVSLGTGLDVIERAKRARTLGNLVRNVFTALVVSIAALMVLRELRVDILPVLTGAGVLGLAVGFGAQTLVRDVLSGFFLILENQIRVGDVVEINGVGGAVEAINLRTTVLRDIEGVVHVFPNGRIDRLSNKTMDFSYYLIDLNVAQKEDTDRVIEVLRQIGAELMLDAACRPHILEPLEVLGVEAFQASQVTIKLRLKTVPQKQWDVGRELRRRIKKTFERQGIELR